MSGIMKRKDLTLGHEYLILFKPTHWVLPGTKIYKRVQLVELKAGNRAVVQWDEWTYSADMQTRITTHLRERNAGAKTLTDFRIKRTRMAIVSCGTFLGSVQDFERRGSMYCVKRKHMVLKPETPESVALVSGDVMDALRRGHNIEFPEQEML